MDNFQKNDSGKKSTAEAVKKIKISLQNLKILRRDLLKNFKVSIITTFHLTKPPYWDRRNSRTRDNF